MPGPAACWWWTTRGWKIWCTNSGAIAAGHLGVAPEVADLRITGSFPLHDTDLALSALLPTLPVQIEQHTQWWVTVAKAIPSPESLCDSHHREQLAPTLTHPMWERACSR